MAKDLRISMLKDIYGGLLTDNQRELIELYYDCDLSLKEIADNASVTRQAVKDTLDKGVSALLKYEDKLKVYDKITSVKSLAEKGLNCENTDAMSIYFDSILKLL